MEKSVGNIFLHLILLFHILNKLLIKISNDRSRHAGFILNNNFWLRFQMAAHVIRNLIRRVSIFLWL